MSRIDFIVLLYFEFLKKSTGFLRNGFQGPVCVYACVGSGGQKCFFPLSVAKQTLKKQKAELDALTSKLAEMETQISNKVLCKIKI